MTDKNHDDTDFNLNKFESDSQDSDAETAADAMDSATMASSYADDDFPPPWASDNPDSNAADDDRIEPGIPDTTDTPAQTDLFDVGETAETNHFEASPVFSESDNQPEASRAEPAPNMEPPMTDTFQDAAPEEQKNGNKPITLFAILAILIVALAIWSNLGGKDHDTHSGQLQTETVPATDTRMQSLENRMASLERHVEQQNDTMMQQIDRLERDVNKLSRGINQQARQRHAARPARKATVNKVHPVQHQQPTTTAVASHQATGWVVSLVSVDTLAAAKKVQSDFTAKGISTEISLGKVNGKTWYRVRIPGFANKAEALAQKNYLENKFHITNTWVHKP